MGWGSLAALLAALALQAGCAPQELVLRRASFDWEGQGIAAVAVLPVPPEAPRMVMSRPATASPAPGGQTAQDGSSHQSAADLAAATRDASELLAFALLQSAVTVEAERPGQPRLEVTVKEMEAGEAPPGGERRSEASSRRPGTIPSLREELGIPRPPERVVRATVLVRLISPASTRPLWFKEAVGTVDIGARGGIGGADPFPPSRSLQDDDADTLAFYREIAVRRALKQIADDLLPRYEYRELR